MSKDHKLTWTFRNDNTPIFPREEVPKFSWLVPDLKEDRCMSKSDRHNTKIISHKGTGTESKQYKGILQIMQVWAMEFTKKSPNKPPGIFRSYSIRFEWSAEPVLQVSWTANN